MRTGARADETRAPSPTGRVRRRRPRLSRWLTEIGILVGVLFGTSLRAAESPVLWAPPAALVVVNVVGLGVVLALRFRWPVIALTVTGAVSVASILLDVYTFGAVTALFVTARTVADRRSRATALWSTAVLTVVVLGAQVIADKLTTFDTLVALAWAAAWGMASRARRQYLEALEERAERAERTRESEASRRVAEERLAIARDLHDTVAHQVAVVNLQAAAASAAVRERPGEAEAALSAIRGAARTVLAEIASLLTDLRSGTSAAAGVPNTVHWSDMLDTLVRDSRTSGLQVSWEVNRSDDVDAEIVQVIARVLQEALTNAHRHGAGSCEARLLQRGESLVLDVRNPIADGERTSEGAGFGVLGMQERAHLAGGVLTVGPDDKGWWTVLARMPRHAGRAVAVADETAEERTP